MVKGLKLKVIPFSLQSLFHLGFNVKTNYYFSLKPILFFLDFLFHNDIMDSEKTV